MKLFRNIVIVLLGILVLAACEKNSTPEPEYKPDVYVAGMEQNGEGINRVVLWKNGILQYLSDGNNHSEGHSVYVAGDDVYVAGHELNGQGIAVATLWKNGAAQRLSSELYEAYAESIYVEGNDVYVVGKENNVAVLWKNGVVQKLSDNWSEANFVRVTDGDVYVAGSNAGRAELWKNSVPQSIFTGEEATSVYVVGVDLYVSGKEYILYEDSGERVLTARLWKNGEIQNLSNSRLAVPHAVYVWGEDVYVVGGSFDAVGQGRYTATLWKNGVVQYFGDGNLFSGANSIFVWNDDVYIVGYNHSNAVLWKNGIAQGGALPKGNLFAIAYSVFVK